MPAKAKVYISITIVVGFALLAGSLIGSSQVAAADRFLACLALACIASTLKVKVPGITGNMSVNFVFVLVAVAQLSLSETLVVACSATLVQCLWRTKTAPKLVQVLFNMATMLTSSAAAWETAHAVPSAPYSPIALAPAAMVYFALNSGMVSLVLALLSGKPLTGIWKQAHLWTFPYYLVGAVIASLVCLWGQTAGWRPPLLLLVPMYFVYFHYSMLVAQRTRVDLAPGGATEGGSSRAS